LICQVVKIASKAIVIRVIWTGERAMDVAHQLLRLDSIGKKLGGIAKLVEHQCAISCQIVRHLSKVPRAPSYMTPRSSITGPTVVFST
jgi:hypothetical protein